MSIKVENGIPIVPQPFPMASDEAVFTVNTVAILENVEGGETAVAATNVAAVSLAATSGIIDVPLFSQQRTLWCWAACAKMVLHSLGENVRQCRIANSLLDNNCCAASCGKTCCNNDCSEDDVATVYEAFGVNADFHDGMVSFSTLQEEISDNGSLVEVAIDWPGDNGGHLLVVNGWSRYQNVRWVNVKDPIYGEGEIRYSELIEYEGGRWVFTWTGLNW